MSEFEKVLQQFFPVFCEDRLRVKLYAFHLFGSMPQPHHEAVWRGSGNLQAVRDALSLDDQRMIAAGCKSFRKLLKDRLTVMRDLDWLAVDRFWSTFDGTAKILSNRLMTETNS